MKNNSIFYIRQHEKKNNILCVCEEEEAFSNGATSWQQQLQASILYSIILFYLCMAAMYGKSIMYGNLQYVASPTGERK